MDNDIFGQFGQFLQSLRKAKELSQEQLAEIAELDRTYISLLERGKRNPSLSCILAICQALDLNFMDKLQTQDWVTELVQFCNRYDLEVEYLPEILNDPKVIPMIRGKSFEFTVKKHISQILPNNYMVTNPRLNAQTGSYDVDVLVINKHNRQEEFDFVVTSIGNAFYETDERGLYFWKPTLNAQQFLKKSGINNQADAFTKMFIARSRDLIANENNYTNFSIKCTRRECQDTNCGFIPNYPIIYFDKNTGIPLTPWIPLEEISSLLD